MLATTVYLAAVVATASALQRQSPNSPDEDAPSAVQLLETTHIDIGVAHDIQHASLNVNGGLVVQQSSNFQFGAKSASRSVEFGGTSTFRNQRYNDGKTIVPNGKKQCKMQHKDNRELAMKPACIDDDWGYFVRAELKDVRAFDQVQEMTKYQYTHKCDGHFFIACLERSMFSGATRDIYSNIQDWCLQVDNFMVRMSRANLTKARFLEADLNYMKSNCQAVATQEAVARLASHEEALEKQLNTLRKPLGEIQALLPAKGPPGNQGPASSVVGPVGPQGPRGIDGPAVLGVRGEKGERGPIGKPGRDGIDGRIGKDGSDPRNIPNAASCMGSYCVIPGQFCPPNAPGSDGHGRCCDKSTGQWGEPTENNNTYACQ